MKTDEIRALRERFIVASTIGHGTLKFSHAQLEFLIHILRSHIIWREWLVPED